MLFFLFFSSYEKESYEIIYQNKLVPNNAVLKSDRVQVTFYGGGASENGGYAGKIAYADINGGNLSIGMVAASPSFLSKDTVIYVETTPTGEGSFANGKYFYVGDTGVTGEHIDVAVPDSNNAAAEVSQSLLNAAPYGTGWGKLYIVKENSTWEEYLEKYFNLDIPPNKTGSSTSGHTYKYGKCTVNDGDYSGDVKDGYIYNRFQNTFFQNLHSTEDIEKKSVKIIQEIFNKTIKMYGNPSICGGNYNGSGGGFGMNTAMWWPIGSKETTVENGVTFASGNPETVTISSKFGGRKINGEASSHGGIDISGNGKVGYYNVIAAMDGTVVYPTDKSQTQYSDNGYYHNPDGGGFGNYVMIEHSNGIYTYYAHMAKDSITVKAGDKVKQGQVIGKIGNSGSSTGPHLHFEIREGGNSRDNQVDPLKYVDPDNPRPLAYAGGNWSLTETPLSEAEFVSKMKAYCQSSGNQAFCTNFADHAEEVYRAALQNNVNPELVVVTAGAEQGWKKTCGYNFYGIGIYNGQGCSSGAQYSSLADGIAGYAKVLSTYMPNGSHASMIEERFNQREQAGCDAAGHGHAGTLEGMQSVYSWLGDYRNSGECYYLKLIYPNYQKCDGTPTTVCEQNDYTAWQLNQKYKMRFSIFGY